MAELVLAAGYDSNKIFKNKKAFNRYAKGLGGALGIEPEGIVYLDDLGRALEIKNDKTDIRKITKKTVEEEGTTITKLVVKYKGKTPIVPDNIRNMLGIRSRDG